VLWVTRFTKESTGHTWVAVKTAEGTGGKIYMSRPVPPYSDRSDEGVDLTLTVPRGSVVAARVSGLRDRTIGDRSRVKLRNQLRSHQTNYARGLQCRQLRSVDPGNILHRGTNVPPAVSDVAERPCGQHLTQLEPAEHFCACKEK